MRINSTFLYLIALIGTALIVFLCYLLAKSERQNDIIKNRMQELESKNAQQEQVHTTAIATAGPGAATSPADQKIKDLSTRFVGDTRSLAEKLRDFTAENTDHNHIAIACKVIAELAENRDALPDEDLNWLYQTQTHPELKRVIAQVTSLRGDNHLLNDYIKQLQPGLANSNPNERRKALGELAKTRYAGAAILILPRLKDEDSSVLLDALLALRVTGNEGHLKALEPLINHSDEPIRWLAGDVANNLETLSKKARTRVSTTDILLDLPPIMAQ
jgi:hypothetical protein